MDRFAAAASRGSRGPGRERVAGEGPAVFGDGGELAIALAVDDPLRTDEARPARTCAPDDGTAVGSRAATHRRAGNSGRRVVS